MVSHKLLDLGAELRELSGEEKEKLIREHSVQIRCLAKRIAAKLPPGTLEEEDLIDIGILGLLQAARNFDPARGIKFKTFAESRIKGAMLDTLRSLDPASRGQRRKAKQARQTYMELEQKLGRAPSDEEMAAALNLPLAQWYALLDEISCLGLGLFQPARDGQATGPDDGSQLIAYFPDSAREDPYFVFYREELKRIIAKAIEELPEEERLVVSLYYFEELTFKEVAMVLAMKEAQAWRLHAKALIRLRAKLHALSAKSNGEK